jgi:hypothetical protein
LRQAHSQSNRYLFTVQGSQAVLQAK